MGKKRPKSLSLGFNYKGELSEPIDAAYATDQYVAYRKRRNTILLFGAMKVRPGDWEGLAIALASYHVPGFQVASFEQVSIGGRPIRYSVDDRVELAQKIDEIISEAKLPNGVVARRNVKGAYKHLMTQSGSDSWKKPDDRSEVDWHTSIQKLVSEGRRLAKMPRDEAATSLLPDFLKDFQKPRRALLREKGKA